MPSATSTIARVGRRRTEPDQSTYSGRLAARVRSVRRRKGIEVKDMAERLGIAAATLYQYESGRREIPVSIAVAIGQICELKGDGDIFPRG